LPADGAPEVRFERDVDPVGSSPSGPAIQVMQVIGTARTTPRSASKATAVRTSALVQVRGF
jgi:hypothetical protein